MSLKKEICKTCKIRSKGYIFGRWGMNDDVLWEDRKELRCPYRLTLKEMIDLGPNMSWETTMSIFAEPPERCPYVLEQMLEK